jgi:hypothetical protein
MSKLEDKADNVASNLAMMSVSLLVGAMFTWSFNRALMAALIIGSFWLGLVVERYDVVDRISRGIQEVVK